MVGLLPTFCRHNRFAETCPICARKPRTESSAPAASRRAPRKTSGARRTSRGGAAAGGLTVRRLARAEDDGYDNQLVPGLRSSADAAKLAHEIAFAAARLEELYLDPPGLYAEVAAESDRDEAAWLCFLIAWISPAEEGDPWAGITAARVPFSTGEVPDVSGVPLGERTACDPGRAAETIARLRQLAGRAGSLAALLEGEATLTPGRRFDRAYERMAVPGLHRGARFELLVLAGRLGVAALEPTSLQLGTREAAQDPVVVAAKRVFGIGDPVLLGRRASELAGAAGAPLAALDLALFNWARPEDRPVRAGSRAQPDAAVEAAGRAALGLPDES